MVLLPMSNNANKNAGEVNQAGNRSGPDLAGPVIFRIFLHFVENGLFFSPVFFRRDVTACGQFIQLGNPLLRALLRSRLGLRSLSLLLRIVSLIFLVVSTIPDVASYPGHCNTTEKRAAIGMGLNTESNCNDAESTQHQFCSSIHINFHVCIPLERLAGAKNRKTHFITDHCQAHSSIVPVYGHGPAMIVLNALENQLIAADFRVLDR